MRKENTKIMAYAVILLTVSLVLGYIEAIFPINVGQIGIKIGLSNIVSIIGLKTIGFRKTFLINVLRLIILGILFANVVRFTLSVSGFLLSYIVMSFMLCKLSISVIISSIFGGVFHNVGQFIALIFIMSNVGVLYLIPIYIIIGIFTGLLVGIISKLVLKNVNLYKFY